MERVTPSNRGGELLRAAIERLYGGRQDAAAVALELHRSMLTHLISGQRRPSLRTAIYLQRTVDIPCLAWLEPPAGAAA